MSKVQAMADVKIIRDPFLIAKNESPKDKPYLQVTFEDGTVVLMSLTLAEMVGGVGAGANQRFGFTTGQGGSVQ